MSTVEEVEQAVRHLSPADRAAFRAWFAEFDWEEWDRQLEADIAAGRLDWLIAEARQNNQAGNAPTDETSRDASILVVLPAASGRSSAISRSELPIAA